MRVQSFSWIAASGLRPPRNDESTMFLHDNPVSDGVVARSDINESPHYGNK